MNEPEMNKNKMDNKTDKLKMEEEQLGSSETLHVSDDVIKSMDTKSMEAEDLDALGAARLTKGLLSETDDPLMPAFTVRAVVIGSLGAVALGFVNAVLFYRTNAFTVPSTIITLLAYPIAVFSSVVLPRGILNPGPFTIKEHALVTIIASAGGGLAYGIDNVGAQYMTDLMNDKRVNFWNSLLWVLSTQLIGYGMAGLTRRFLVRPQAMLWPTSLPVIATLLGFHKKPDEESGVEKPDNRYRLSRYAMFWICFAALFVWTWIPNYFAPGLAVVSLFCFFSTNKMFKQFAGANFGMGIGALSFDWTVFSTFGPVITPWWATVNFTVACIFSTWILTPIIWATNPWGTPALSENLYGTDLYRFNTAHLYNRNGTRVNIQKLYSKPNYNLNQTAYDAVAPLYISPYFALLYMASFLSLSAGISHVFVWYSRDLSRQLKEAWHQMDESSPDVHNRLMKAYPDIPEWMYLTFLGAMVVVQIFVLEFTPFYLPWWATLLGILIPLIFLFPFGIIQAISGFQLGLNVITEFLIGMILPGHTVSVMVFKSFSYNTFIQALNLTSDLKIGHYLHINPIAMVASQFIGTILGAIANTAGSFFTMNSSLLVNNPADWGNTATTIFYSAGAIWGAVGPIRFFGRGSPYFGLMLAFPIGLILPVLPWLLNKKYPNKLWHLINFPILCNWVQPGYQQVYVIVPFAVAFFFQFYLYRYKYEFFSKYNYVMSAGFDGGSSLAIILIVVLTTFNTLPTLAPNVLNPANGSSDFYCYDGMSV